MSQELTRFRIVDFHSDQCQKCTKCKHSNSVLLPGMQSQLSSLRNKRTILERKIRETSLQVGELERQARELAVRGRHEYKEMLMYRLSIQAGYLHMLLRYSVILKRDTIRVQYQIHCAHNKPHHQARLNYTEDRSLEVAMARDAPDLASLLKYDWYPAPRENAGESWEDEYSLLPQLYWHLTM